jgi:hypothetical protein
VTNKHWTPNHYLDMTKSNGKSHAKQQAKGPQPKRKNKGSMKAGNRKQLTASEDDAASSGEEPMDPHPCKKARRGGNEASEEIIELDDDDPEEVMDDGEEEPGNGDENVSH